jgi:hypothetical protein
MDSATNENTQLMKPSKATFLCAEPTLEELWQYFYEMAYLFARTKNLVSSLGCYTDAFLIRGKAHTCKDKDWLDFFRRQFSIYLMGKKQISCSLCEGDMIHDFLKSEYQEIRKALEESELPFHTDNLASWFASLELDFPWCFEDDGSDCAIG